MYFETAILDDLSESLVTESVFSDSYFGRLVRVILDDLSESLVTECVYVF